ncbi:unnamed protein product [Jaminaea pallidilutea]
MDCGFLSYLNGDIADRIKRGQETTGHLLWLWVWLWLWLTRHPTVRQCGAQARAAATPTVYWLGSFLLLTFLFPDQVRLCLLVHIWKCYVPSIPQTLRPATDRVTGEEWLQLYTSDSSLVQHDDIALRRVWAE